MNVLWVSSSKPTLLGTVWKDTHLIYSTSIRRQRFFLLEWSCERCCLWGCSTSREDSKPSNTLCRSSLGRVKVWGKPLFTKSKTWSGICSDSTSFSNQRNLRHTPSTKKPLWNVVKKLKNMELGSGHPMAHIRLWTILPARENWQSPQGQRYQADSTSSPLFSIGSVLDSLNFKQPLITFQTSSPF